MLNTNDVQSGMQIDEQPLQKALGTDDGRGHGHVRPRADGLKARCGGPGLCRVCKQEGAQFAHWMNA